MGRNLAALVAGLVFGLGLAVSQMINPLKVLAFLDVAGAWDPSLLVVLVSAVAVYAVGYRLALRRPRPLLAERFEIPSRRDLDARLIGGAALFGIGWGVGGYCPGPAISALALGFWEPLVFIAAMAAGAACYGLLAGRA